MNKKLVKIIIPIYQASLSRLERDIVLNNLRVLSRHEFVFVIPKSLAIYELEAQIGISKHAILRVSDNWLGRKNGIRGYNEMMMSKSFYELFRDSKYILICQCDAFVFRDDLEFWCSRGFDYIGAPWLKRQIYNIPIFKQYLALRRFFFSSRLKPIKQDLLNKVGNGGLSLRHVENLIAACETYSYEIEHFKLSFARNGKAIFNEDVFWATVPREFNYPSANEALGFAIDSRPELCLEARGGKLPFGCHGLTQESLFSFWCDKIELLKKHIKHRQEKKVPANA